MASPDLEPRQTKDQRLNVRISSRQEQLIRYAAATTDRTLTDFLVDSAVERAERILADRRWFVATPEQWEEFERLLDAPLPSTAKFRRLAAMESPFEESPER